MEDILGVLERTGFSKIEAKVYLTLLKLGSSKAGKISKKAQLNRTTTYDALRRLLDKGLAGYVVKENRKWFTSIGPEKLIEILKEREHELKKIVPSLKQIYKEPEEKHNVTLFYGYKGMRSVFQDIIREGKTNHVMDSEGQFTERMPYYAPHFIRQLEKNKIKVYHLVKEGRDVQPSKTTAVRFIKKKTRSEAVVNIYSDKVAILIWTDPPEAVVINNKTVADSFKDYFWMLWKNTKI